MNGRFLRRPAIPGDKIERIPVAGREEAEKVSGARPALGRTEFLTPEEYSAAIISGSRNSNKRVADASPLPFERPNEIKERLLEQQRRSGPNDPARMRRRLPELSPAPRDYERLSSLERRNLDSVKKILERGELLNISTTIDGVEYKRVKFNGFTPLNDIVCDLFTAQGYPDSFTMSAEEFLNLFK